MLGGGGKAKYGACVGSQDKGVRWLGRQLGEAYWHRWQRTAGMQATVIKQSTYSCAATAKLLYMQKRKLGLQTDRPSTCHHVTIARSTR